VSRYNASVTEKMLDAAAAEHRARGGLKSDLAIVEAPGSYELVALAAAAARTGLYAGVCCLGCIVKGETRHDEFIAHAVATGLAQISVATGVPVAFGVLTTTTSGQAAARAGGAKGNKGAEAMSAVLDAMAAVAAMHQAAAAKTPGFEHRASGMAADKLTGAARASGGGR
jgi:6,7-dimethyl-8-ribityllumazine synthase